MGLLFPPFDATAALCRDPHSGAVTILYRHTPYAQPLTEFTVLSAGFSWCEITQPAMLNEVQFTSEGRNARLLMQQPCTEGTTMLSASSWYAVYRAAMLESDRNRALSNIDRAKKAIQARLAELRILPGNTREAKDLTSALDHLRILLRHASAENWQMLWDKSESLA